MLAAPSLAGAKKAQCFLQVDGATHIDGVCETTPVGKDGAFDIARGGWFAFVDPKGDGTADVTWNREEGRTSILDGVRGSWADLTFHQEGARRAEAAQDLLAATPCGR
jgi:hypothetical protein